MTFTQNTILITGGGSGIGRALAEALQELGNQVIIAGRGRAKLEETTAQNPGMKSVVLDIGNVESLSTFATELVAAYPTLNVVLQCAGVMIPEDVLQPRAGRRVDEETIATNLLGPIRLTTELLPHLRQQPQAAVITVSSGLAFVPLAFTPTYCATKAAIHSYSQSLRYQLRKTKVQVIEIVPPYVATGLMGDHQASDPRAMPLDEYIQETIKLLQTVPTPKEILVKRVHPLRFAADQGHAQYEAFFQSFNDSMSEGH